MQVFESGLFTCDLYCRLGIVMGWRGSRNVYFNSKAVAGKSAAALAHDIGTH